MVEDWARTPLPALQPASRGDLSERMLLMLAALPKRSSDELSGRLLEQAYWLKLGHLPLAALDYLVDRALEICKWFPTIAECLEIVTGFQRQDDPIRLQREAERLAARELLARFDDARLALRRGELDQAAIDALPPRWKHSFEAQSLLRVVDGGYVACRMERLEGPEIDPETALGRLADQFPSLRENVGEAR
jgi:hypothetical protein